MTLEIVDCFSLVKKMMLSKENLGLASVPSKWGLVVLSLYSVEKSVLV